MKKCFFDAELATEIGVNAAILFEFLNFQGTTTISLTGLRLIFPFFEELEIREALNTLISEGYVSAFKKSI